MIQRRAAAPGPRTVALHRVLATFAGLLLLAVLVGACGTSGVSPSAVAPSGPAPSSSPAAGGSSGLAIGPAAPSASAAAGGSAAPDASQPRWPGTTVLATIAMGAADGEIQKAGNDLQAAADARDLKAMWGAADGLAKMIDALMPNIDRLEIYSGTQPAAAIYRKSFPELSAGAKQLRDSITAGDANGIVAGSQAIAQGLADYGPVRELIAGLVEQAILQQRLLVE